MFGPKIRESGLEEARGKKQEKRGGKTREKIGRTWEEAKVRKKESKFGKVQAEVKNQRVTEDFQSQR